MVWVSACLVIPNSATGQQEALNLSALVNIQVFPQWTLEWPEVAERLRVSAERQTLSSLDFSFRRFGIQPNGSLMFIKCSFVTFASWSDPCCPHPNNLLWICSPQQLEALDQTLVISGGHPDYRCSTGFPHNPLHWLHVAAEVTSRILVLSLHQILWMAKVHSTCKTWWSHHWLQVSTPS